MENNVALTLREIADQLNEEQEKKEIATHQEFIETEILPHLQEMAQKGKYQTDLTVFNYDSKIIRNLLRKMGFAVNIVNLVGCYRLIVKW